MITRKEQKKLKKIIGSHYTDEVLAILMHKEILNKNGKSHNAEYIRMVFQGYRNNKDIEQAIWELAVKKSSQAEIFAKQKNKVLNVKGFGSDPNYNLGNIHD